jgi:peptidoglycan/xylan/chitin deacetylase (PgdA/CDA1 family)
MEETAKDIRSRYLPIKDFEYPQGVKLAVSFTVDFDAQVNRRLKNEPTMELTQGEFGGRVGIWRLLDLFDRHGIKLTIFTPGRVCELYPEVIREAAKRGHEIANHMWEHRVPPEPDWEKDHLQKATAAIEKLCGKRPVGTRSSHKISSLKNEGYIYTSNEGADDLPYYVLSDDGKDWMLNLPYHYVLDDAMYFHFGWYGSGNAGQNLVDPGRVFEIWQSAFRQLYRMGRYMNIISHGFVSGRSLRVAMIEGLIIEIKQKPGIWFCTCEELARYCLAQYTPPPH